MFKPAKAWSKVTRKCSDTGLAVLTGDGAAYPKNSDNGTVTITTTIADDKKTMFELTLWSALAHTGNLENCVGKSLATM